jgi:hypothetical protein
MYHLATTEGDGLYLAANVECVFAPTFKAETRANAWCTVKMTVAKLNEIDLLRVHWFFRTYPTKCQVQFSHRLLLVDMDGALSYLSFKV